MGKLIERCAGIDIGKRFLVCCVMTGAAHEEPRSETRRFDTTVPGLKRLRNWLNEERVTDVVMESTGSYWIPVFNLLEGHVRVVLANPEEVKNRKGHKTDRKDAGHLADLLRHNHVKSSYIPAEPVRQLRDLTRRRVQLTQDATRERNRVQKLLEQVNVKIGSVLTDVFGVSGLHMLLALLDGRAAPEEIAGLARGSAKRKTPQLIEAIEGNRMSDHVRFLIRGCLRHLACLEEEVEELDTEILRAIQVFPSRFQRLAPRRGENRAIIAVAHHMLIILYCMLKRGVPFLGAEHAPNNGGGNVVLTITCDALGVSVSRWRSG